MIIDPFLTNFPPLHPLKTLESLQFSDRSGTFVENGLMYLGKLYDKHEMCV